MKSVQQFTQMVTALLLFVIVGVGCSDDTIVTYVDGNDISSKGQVESFFPMGQGYTTIYNVSYPSSGTSEIVTFRAGEKEQFQSHDVTPWYGFSNSTVDTGYFYASSDALYYLNSLGSSSDKLLEFPLSVGKAWNSESSGDNYIDIITGTDDSTGTGGGTYGKTFPTISAVQYSITDIAGITMDHGVYYSNAILVSTENGNKSNYYWYVNGIGLVRYVIGATDVSFPSGDVVGELVQYGY